MSAHYYPIKRFMFEKSKNKNLKSEKIHPMYPFVCLSKNWFYFWFFFRYFSVSFSV